MARRRLRLEFLEDRALPAGQPPAGGSDTDLSADPSPASEASEYRAEYTPAVSESGPTRTPPDGDAAKGGVAYTEDAPAPGKGVVVSPERDAEAAEYARTITPATTVTTPAAPPAVPTTTHLTPEPAVALVNAQVVTAPISPGPAVPQPPGFVAPPLPVVAGPSASPAPTNTAAETADPEQPPTPTPTPVSARAESPAVAVPEPPPLSPAAALARFVDDLAVRVDLPAGWDEAAAHLVDGLTAAADDLADPEAGWTRLGYWAVSLAAVGVAVELSRQAARGRRPADGPSPVLVVKR
jgi:hypothetical protein